jgi:branched-chain amino acid transport system substrate-binding protein
VAEPVRVGILNDGVGARDGSDEGGTYRQLERDMRLAVDAVAASGRLDRPVEFVHQYGFGLPAGTAHAVERAFSALVDQGVLLVVGPAVGDNAIVATPLADRYEMPTINWSASERARGSWMFHLQVGSHEDESILLARHLASIGVSRVGVIYDRSPIGHRHLVFFEEECELVGVGLSARLAISPLPPDGASAEVAAVRASGAEALVYMGLGWAGRDVAVARTALGWDAPAAMNAAGMRGSGDPSYAADIEGWVYPDMYADGNALLGSLRAGPGRDRARPGGLALGYDMGRLVAEGIARAQELSRPGIRDGLERIKVVPAAEGQEGTTLGFGRWERGALKGRYLVLRRWVGGESVELGASGAGIGEGNRDG